MENIINKRALKIRKDRLAANPRFSVAGRGVVIRTICEPPTAIGTILRDATVFTVSAVPNIPLLWKNRREGA
jgi:hypothetical protein